MIIGSGFREGGVGGELVSKEQVDRLALIGGGPPPPKGEKDMYSNETMAGLN